MPDGDAPAADGVPAIVFAPVASAADLARPEGAGELALAAAPAIDVDSEPAVDLVRLESLLESLLLAAGAPVPLPRLVEVLDGPARRDVVAALKGLGERYEREGRGLRLVHVAGGWQLRSAPEHGPLVRKLLGGRPPRLSRAMLETLAIVAYRQPCTKPEIEAIRGVDADATLNTLLERRMVKITGRKDAPGRPLLYATTREFLEVFGLPDLNALPPLAELGTGAELLAAPDLTIGPGGVQATPTPAAALGFTNGVQPVEPSAESEAAAPGDEAAG
ncbi:MAG: SMC-Scp complex subunit ScpB [bacterium]|nr:SMC-Scp complex subunit ScpB [bacterium]